MTKDYETFLDEKTQLGGNHGFSPVWMPPFLHIIKFEVEATRFDPVNLVTLCPKCHGFVHSKANVHGEFIKGGMA